MDSFVHVFFSALFHGFVDSSMSTLRRLAGSWLACCSLAGLLAAAGCWLLPGWLAGWLLAGWLAAGLLAGCSLAGWLAKMPVS